MIEPCYILRRSCLGVLLLGCASTCACSGNDTPSTSTAGGRTGTSAEAGPTSTSTGGAPSTGGSRSFGGSAPTGGTISTGGRDNTGGAGSGGTSSAGSAVSSGGVQSSGGTKSSGGNVATGGSKSSGGGKATGGMGTGGVAITGGSSATGGSKATGGTAGTACPYSGHVTYTLARSTNPTAAEQTAYSLITAAMDKAVTFYNCYTNITKAENISYNTSVATADGNINGSIRFGANTGYMDFRTAMHEISHTVGIGQASNWSSFITNGLFTGANANAQLVAINATLAAPLDTVVHADTQHFWPYGINQQSEVKSETDLANIIGHCQMVMAIRKDLGLQ